MVSTPGILWKPWLAAGREAVAALETLADRPRPWTSMALLALAALAAWFVYVPVHELLHAFGCLAAGGTVEELQLQPLYGGRLLARLFPFVHAGGPYAGRLSRFDTGGSDLVYLATDAAPYVLTVFGGFWLLDRARRRGNALLLGPAVVLVTAPLVSLPGDYYEMGSLVVSRVLESAFGATAAAGLRHDDVLALVAEFPQRFPEDRVAWSVAVLVSGLTGYLLACLTLWASQAWSRRLARRGPAP